LPLHNDAKVHASVLAFLLLGMELRGANQCGQGQGRKLWDLSGKALAERTIKPAFVIPSSLIAIEPFRYVSNNPPRFVGQRVWLALLAPLAVFFVIALGLSWAMTACWRRWKSN
jgi:hypothetical protein